MQSRIISQLDDKALQKASVNNLAYAFTQFHSAERLERDLSTVNVASLHADIAALKRPQSVDKPVDKPNTKEIK